MVHCSTHVLLDDPQLCILLDLEEDCGRLGKLFNDGRTESIQYPCTLVYMFKTSR